MELDHAAIMNACKSSIHVFTQPIHILGIGSLGKLFAHSIRKSHPQTPITLIFHRPSLADEWIKAGQCIEVVRGGVPDVQSMFSYELASEGQSMIKALIVATKASSTVQALKPLTRRLVPSSSLLFLQNGIGMGYRIPRLELEVGLGFAHAQLWCRDY